MAYTSIPRLSLNGTIGGEECSGEAWVDHQWGDTGWFQEDGKRPRRESGSGDGIGTGSAWTPERT